MSEPNDITNPNSCSIRFSTPLYQIFTTEIHQKLKNNMNPAYSRAIEERRGYLVYKSFMRLAFVSIDDPEDVHQWSGTPHFVLNELRRQGIDVEVIGPLKRPFKYLFAPYQILARLIGKRVQIDRHEIALLSFARQIKSLIAGKSFDAIFTLSSIPIARLDTGLPIVFWTDAVFEGLVDYYPGPWVNPLASERANGHRQEQAGIQRSSYAIYASDWAREMALTHYQTMPERIEVIEFGANLPIEHDIAEVEAMVAARRNKECILLFIGIDWVRKGGSIAFETAKLLNSRGIKTTLKVVGCEAPAAPFVEQLGFIDKSTPEGRDQFRELLRTSSFLIFPTRAEAAGIVSCEASAYALPVITTQTGGVTNYVKNDENGFCLPLEAKPDEYADLIERLVMNETAYHDLSLRSFARYRTLLNWNVAITRLVQFLKKAVIRPT